MTTEILDISVPAGLSRAYVDRALARQQLVLILGHGAGGGVQSRDLAALADVLPRRGVTVVRYEQPWRTAGRRVASPPAALDRAWLAALQSEPLQRLLAGAPLVIGGRSAGARVACRTANEVGASGVVALAFPLHPPGRPERSRLAELRAPRVPVVVVQGSRDPFGGPAEFPPDAALVAIPDADHGFAVAKRSDTSQAAALARVAEGVVEGLGKNFRLPLLEPM